MVQYEIRVTGRVQGVGFRYYVQQQAKLLNVNGWVRNTVDGGVLVMAQGAEPAVKTLVDYLWVGPPLSLVKSVHKAELQLIESYTDFEVRY
ncbi:acylphosphatase [uncultured Draconibacterium sp.]|uniref:acylphosphatase n=1 Tax=uncultured Draconibacterium sp. TaxID=1573823 RepID=UPI002AA93AB6|nr:acylphosphatase [uncultured Draconibacterium sp.]